MIRRLQKEMFMRLLVFSDSHGRWDRLKAIIDRSDADAILFLGDGIKDFDRIASDYSRNAILIGVKGNCDGYDGTPDERILALDGVKILMLHGHTRGVKHGLETLEAYGRIKGADLILYGHTHVPHVKYVSEYDRPYYIFNPGSIGAQCYDGASYGYIEFVNGKIVANHVKYEGV